MIKRWSVALDYNIDSTPFARMVEDNRGLYVLAQDIEKEYDVEVRADITIEAEVTKTIMVNALGQDEAYEMAIREVQNNEHDDELRDNIEIISVEDVRVLSVEEA